MLGIPCYGFAPLRLEADVPFLSLFHGHDERVPAGTHGVRGRLLGLAVGERTGGNDEADDHQEECEDHEPRHDPHPMVVGPTQEQRQVTGS